jgi:hypothetical protein
MDREADRQRVQQLITEREQHARDTEAAGSWMSRGLDALEPEPEPQQLVHMLPSPENTKNPYEVARQVRAAQAQQKADPSMQAYIAERRNHVPSAPFGVSGYNTK